ncbi:hypothetical protein BSKO_cp0085 (chloroplast) [Bryopsis sp. KO-2023]|nr:hypothetical protein BSKO_cp0085 [Bryopsis sp. KO-2023]
MILFQTSRIKEGVEAALQVVPEDYANQTPRPMKRAGPSGRTARAPSPTPNRARLLPGAGCIWASNKVLIIKANIANVRGSIAIFLITVAYIQ